MSRSSKGIGIHRFFFLDKLRFFCAFSVLLYHYTTISQAGNKHSVYEYPFFDSIFRYGYLGVDVFFIISGFVIFFSCRSRSAVDFLKGRFIRLYPAYWFAVLLTATVTVAFGDKLGMQLSLTQLLINLTMLQQFLGVPHIDGVYWSLTYELVFYFWVALLLLIFNNKASGYIVTFFGGLTLISLLNYFFPFPRIVANLLLLDWVYYFYIGILFASSRLAGGSKSSTLKFLSCRLTIAIFVAFLYCGRKAVEISAWHQTQVTGWVAVAVVTTVVLYFMAGVFRSQKNTGDGPSESAGLRFSNRVSIYLGGLTYPLYLVHGVNGVILMNILYRAGFIGELALCVTVTFSVLLSGFVYSVVEKNSAALLKKILIGAPRP